MTGKAGGIEAAVAHILVALGKRLPADVAPRPQPVAEPLEALVELLAEMVETLTILELPNILILLDLVRTEGDAGDHRPGHFAARAAATARQTSPDRAGRPDPSRRGGFIGQCLEPCEVRGGAHPHRAAGSLRAPARRPERSAPLSGECPEIKLHREGI